MESPVTLGPCARPGFPRVLADADPGAVVDPAVAPFCQHSKIVEQFGGLYTRAVPPAPPLAGAINVKRDNLTCWVFRTQLGATGNNQDTSHGGGKRSTLAGQLGRAVHPKKAIPLLGRLNGLSGGEKLVLLHVVRVRRVVGSKRRASPWVFVRFRGGWLLAGVRSYSCRRSRLAPGGGTSFIGHTPTSASEYANGRLPTRGSLVSNPSQSAANDLTGTQSGIAPVFAYISKVRAVKHANISLLLSAYFRVSAA